MPENNSGFETSNVRRTDFAFQVLWIVVCAGFCLLTGLFLSSRPDFVGFQLQLHDVALGTAAGVLGTAVPCCLRLGCLRLVLKEPNSMVLSPLISTLWRGFVFGGVLLVITATKWRLDKSLSTSLLGCYFFFILLESWLAIRDTSKKSSSAKPSSSKIDRQVDDLR